MAAEEVTPTPSSSHPYGHRLDGSYLSRLTMTELAQLFEFHGAVAKLAVAGVNAPLATPSVVGVLEDRAEQAWVAQNRVADEALVRRPIDDEEASVRREILVRSALGSDRIDDVILELAAELRTGRS